jgi:hypothetical protein
MGSLPAPLMVSVQFGDLDTFCDELGARGPNVEPVVRICQQVSLAHSDTQAVLPMQHVFGHVSYLRRRRRAAGHGAAPGRCTCT